MSAGFVFHLPVQKIGTKAVNSGPGDTFRQLEIAKRLASTVLLSFPIFAMKVAAAGGTDFRRVLTTGEAFSSIEGYRERMRDAFGGNVQVSDTYGLSGFNLIAVACRYERGIHVMEECVYPEIIDTGKTGT